MRKETIKSFKNFSNSLENAFIVILILGEIYLTIIFMGHWHAIDTAYNSKNQVIQINNLLRNYSLYLPNGYSDLGTDMISRPIDVYYIQSMSNLRYTFLEAIFISILLGILLCNKFELRKK